MTRPYIPVRSGESLHRRTFDVLVLGGGIAGLTAAIGAARRWRVGLLTKSTFDDTTTFLAQGGIAAALGPSDSPELHFEDTVNAGAGLCDEEAVRVLVNEGPDRVRELMEICPRFDKVDGEIVLGREGAHSVARVVHAGGDATGSEVSSALAEAARVGSRVQLYENEFVIDLLTVDGRCVGALTLNLDDGGLTLNVAMVTILATGGAGQVFGRTTNPLVATGDGVAMAYRAGAAIRDLEFVQFHPTGLAVPGQETVQLITEALRGEGAYLRNAAGAVGHRHPVPRRHQRIRGAAEHLTRATGRKDGDHGDVEREAAVVEVESERPHAAPVHGEQVDDELVLVELDPAAHAGGLGEGARHLAAGRVAAGVDDARHRVRALAPEDDLALYLVEARADLHELSHAVRALIDEDAHRLLVAEAGAGVDGVLEVELGGVRRAQSRGDAALGEEGRRVVEGRLGEQPDAPAAGGSDGRRQAGDAPAEHEDVEGAPVKRLSRAYGDVGAGHRSCLRGGVGPHRLFARHVLRELSHVKARHAAGEVPHLRERHEHEGAAEHARMRQHQFWLLELDVLEEEYIDIERARPEAEPPHAPVFTLDALALRQEVVGFQSGLHAHHLVEEVRLVGVVVRRRLVDTRRHQHGRPRQRRKGVARRREHGLAVAHVGNAREKGALAARVAHRVRTTSTRAASTGTLTGGATLATPTSTRETSPRSHSASAITVASRSSRWNSPPSTMPRTTSTTRL